MNKRIVAWFLACMLLLAAAASLAEAVPAMAAMPVRLDDVGELGEAGEEGAMEPMMMFRPAPLNMTPELENDLSYMGIAFTLPVALREMILNNEIFMVTDDEMDYGIEPDINGLRIFDADAITPEDMRIVWAGVELLFIPEAARAGMPLREKMEAGDLMEYEDFLIWKESLYSLYRISMLPEGEPAPEGYAETVEMGSFGGYTYYVSMDGESAAKPDNADELLALCHELLAQTTVSEPRPIDERFTYAAGTYTEDITSIAAFDTTDLDGNAVSNAVFQDAKVTMVNIFTTWCSPCIQEMPDLAEIAKELGGENFQLIGIVQDALDERTGEIDPDKIALAKTICEKTGVEYPVLVPDEGMKEMLQGILGFPTTYFVDQNGEVIGESYLGSRTKAEWLDVIAEVTAQLEAGK